MTPVNPMVELAEESKARIHFDLLIAKEDLEGLLSGVHKGIGYYDSDGHEFLVIRMREKDDHSKS